MLIECSTCSRLGIERSNPQGEAREGESVSRNASELDSASLHYSGSGQLVMVGETCYCWKANIPQARQTSSGWLETACRERKVEELGRPIRAENARVEPNGFAMGVGGIHNSEEAE